MNQMLGGWYSNFHGGRLCPEMQSKFTYLAFMNFQEQMQSVLNKKLEHIHYNNVHIPYQRAFQAVWLYMYNCTTVLILVQAPTENQTLSG